MPSWVRVASVSDLAVGRGKTVEAGGREIAIFNAGDGGYRACSGSCPHEGGPLGDGLYDQWLIVCPWHGLDFDPETGACRIDPELSVSVYPVRVEGEDVLVGPP